MPARKTFKVAKEDNLVAPFYAVAVPLYTTRPIPLLVTFPRSDRQGTEFSTEESRLKCNSFTTSIGCAKWDIFSLPKRRDYSKLKLT